MFGRTRRALAAANARADTLTKQLAKAADARRDKRDAADKAVRDAQDRLIDGLIADYYAAVADLDDKTGSRAYLDGRIGVLHQVQEVLARVTDTDTVIIAYRLDHGIPPGPRGDGYFAWNAAMRYSDPPLHRLRKPDGTEVDLAEHVQSLVDAHRRRDLVTA